MQSLFEDLHSMQVIDLARVQWRSRAASRSSALPPKGIRITRDLRKKPVGTIARVSTIQSCLVQMTSRRIRLPCFSPNSDAGRTQVPDLGLAVDTIQPFLPYTCHKQLGAPPERIWPSTTCRLTVQEAGDSCLTDVIAMLFPHYLVINVTPYTRPKPDPSHKSYLPAVIVVVCARRGFLASLLKNLHRLRFICAVLCACHHWSF